MKKILFLSLCVLLIAALLTGCGCEHVWKDANCETPKTCSECGETEGAPNGHVWNAATCDAAKVCETCKKTEGEALGHKWLDADCENPKTCESCKKTEGEALGHSWKEATTEAPKTCETCLATEGTAIEVDSRFNTAACQEVFGTWTGSMEVDGAEELGITLEGQDLTYITYISFTFHKDGTMESTIWYDEESFLAVMRVYTKEVTYLLLEEEGMSRADADDYLLMVFGMTMDEYVDAELESLDMADYTYEDEMVYYVEDGQIFAGDDWEDDFTPANYEVVEDVLYMSEDGFEVELYKQ